MRRLLAVSTCLSLTAACAWTPPRVAPNLRASAQSSLVLAADGSPVTTLHEVENRRVVPLERIPSHMQKAVVAIEDRRFWEHNGVDVRAVLRAAVANSSEGKVVEGGSTITQQYVKNEILTSDRTLHRKVKEATLAYQLEKRYSKRQILELYLNSIYFGNGAYGVDAAARDYFGIPVEKVTLDQAALLAGIIRSPTATDPVLNPAAAHERRRIVLDTMEGERMITAVEASAASGVPLQLRDRTGDARYPAPHFVEKVKRFVLDDPRFGPTPAARRKTLFQGGLRISTTLDPGMQAQAEAAVAKVLSAPDRDPAAAVVSIEPRTGYVRALVGGREFFSGGEQGKFDLATQGRRPAGSSFKPIVLAAAIEQGIPLTKVFNAPPQIDIPLPRSTWRVQNYEGRGGGRLNLVEATVQSVNTVYAQLILEVGPDRAVQVAASLGIRAPLQALPSAVLGTNDVSPLDMATAYATFANQGVLVPPTYVTKVVGPDGTVLYQHQHQQKRVLPADTVAALTGVLTQVVERGTGTGARLGRPVAGKTGTGQEWRDAWFVGFTPQLATAVWVGFPDAQRSMVPPASRIRVTGGSWPAQIWQLLMGAALAQKPVEDFPLPPALVGPDGGILPQPTRPVPDVVGMPVEEAEAMLTRDGFLSSRHLVPSDDYPPGRVIAQRPTGEAPGGSTIVLDVSNGPVPRRAVPNVLGLTQAEAVKRLEEAGFTVQVIREAETTSPGSGGRKGKVWKQSPGSGSAAPVGSSVTIWINPK